LRGRFDACRHGSIAQRRMQARIGNTPIVRPLSDRTPLTLS
jgi:hypothetical protein